MKIIARVDLLRKKMNILITGANGFIGSHLVRKLLNLQHKIFITVRSNSDLYRISDIYSKLIRVNVDSQLEEIRRTFQEKKIDGIIHLAGYYRKENLAAEIEVMDKTNIDFPLHLLSLAKEYKLLFFINTGTCFEYAPSEHSIDENSSAQPFNYYASTKLKFEKELVTSIQGSPFKALTLKLFFPYGEQDNNKLVKLLVEQLIRRKKFHVSKGEQYLGYTYVDDIVYAYILALSHILVMRKNYDTFNIGGYPIKISDIFDILEEISKTKGYIIRDKKYADNEIMNMFTNSIKAKQKLGWEQKWNLKDGLQKTYSYYLNQQ